MKSKKILIVEDNDLNRKLFENLIGQLHAYESARNGLEALEKSIYSRFDLILMDIQMPQMDGFTTLKKLKSQAHQSCPIVAVTAYVEESERGNFLEQGFDDLITKPIRPREFLETIQMHLTKDPPSKPLKSNTGVEQVLDKSVIEQLFKYNSKSTLKKVFEDFLQECNQTLQLLQNQESNPEEILAGLHMLKGNSGTLGARRIFSVCQNGEAELRSNPAFQTNELSISLENEIKEFNQFLNQQTIFES